MKKLSDYKGEEAIELWSDLIDSLTIIFSDEELREVVESNQPMILVAKMILKNHTKEATDILLRIDDTPIDGLNIVARLIGLLTEIGENEEVRGFFGFAEQAKTGDKSSGLPTANIEADEK